MAPATGKDDINSERLSWWLRKNKGRSVTVGDGAYRLVADGESRDKVWWLLEPG